MKHFIRLEYDDEKDHFLVEGSNESHRGQYHVTGYKASQVLHLFEQELMWNVESSKRKERKIMTEREEYSQNNARMSDERFEEISKNWEDDFGTWEDDFWNYDRFDAGLEMIAEIGRLRSVCNYLRIQARNGTLHPQVVIQNVDRVLGKD